jgi:hypothetical protein
VPVVDDYVKWHCKSILARKRSCSACSRCLRDAPRPRPIEPLLPELARLAEGAISALKGARRCDYGVDRRPRCAGARTRFRRSASTRSKKANSRWLLFCAPGRIRTSDPRIRSPMLYPAELRVRRGECIARAFGACAGNGACVERVCPRSIGDCGSAALKTFQGAQPTVTAKPG